MTLAKKIGIVLLILVVAAVLFVTVMLRPSLAAETPLQNDPSVSDTQRSQNRVASVKHSSYVLRKQQLNPDDATAGNCIAIRTRAVAVNSQDQFLFSQNQVADWCYRSNTFVRKTVYSQGTTAGNQIWNLWRFDTYTGKYGGDGSVKTNNNGIRYQYMRRHARFVACLQFCFMDWGTFTAQTTRANGTYSHDFGEG